MNLKIGATAFSPRRALMIGFGLVLCAGLAQARTESLRFTQSESSRVARFEAHYGTTNGNYTEVVNLGMPSANASGVRTASITLPDTMSVFMVLRAIGNDGTVSGFSEQQYRVGQSPPPPVAPPAEPPPPPATPPAPPPAPPEPPAESPPPAPPATSGGGSTSAALFDFEPGSTATNSWFDTQPGSSLVGNDSLFTLFSTGAGSVLGSESTASNIHSHVVPHLSVDRNYSVQATLSISSSSSSGIGVTAYSDYPNSDVYYRLGRLGGQTFRIEGHPEFSCSSGGSDTGVIPNAGESYSVLLRVSDEGTQNRLEATVWPLSGNQPAVQAICFDNRPNRPRQGTVGVWATGGGSKFWDNIEIEQIQSIETPLDAPVLIGISRVED